MLCRMICVGLIKGEPKRRYSNKGVEASNFTVAVKRDDNTDKWDGFRFEAWDNVANYINEYLHHGDVVSVISRPKKIVYQNKEGKKADYLIYRVISINLICHGNKIMMNKFGGIDFPAFPDLNYDLF